MTILANIIPNDNYFGTVFDKQLFWSMIYLGWCNDNVHKINKIGMTVIDHD